jgi:hypothetical protein
MKRDGAGREYSRCSFGKVIRCRAEGLGATFKPQAANAKSATLQGLL